MKVLFILLAFLSFSHFTYTQEVKNVILLDNWFQDSLITNSGLARYSGSWGFKIKQEEYAVIGSTEGSHFFQLTDDNKLKPCGFIEGKFNSSLVSNREIKIFKHYAYAVCDDGNSSLQIVDLSYLPDSVVKVADIQNEHLGKVHNIFIDTSNALLFACLVTPIVNGNQQSVVPMEVFSLADPLNPQFLWQGPSDIPEVHDCHVSNKIAFLNCGQDGLRVYDFSNPLAPNFLFNMQFYQDQGYNHQGSLTPNGKIYVFADETSGKRIKKCMVDQNYNLAITNYFGTNYQNNSIPHNIFCDDNFAYVAYYNEGLRIYDIRDVPIEVGAFDTYQSISSFQMNGAWGVYKFPSGRIIVSDRQNGLFLFDFDNNFFLQEVEEDFAVYPNPTSFTTSTVIRSKDDLITHFYAEIVDELGRSIEKHFSGNQSFIVLPKLSAAGIYHLRISYTDYLGEEIIKMKKLINQ
jgi:choice-of-anchor B domain-containing protein